jgi:hypothetical protein
MGQGVGCRRHHHERHVRDVPDGQKLEMPVAEDMQMGMAIGMALSGNLPVCVFPRWNFLICAANQLVNHLDRLPLYSGYKPKVIIRTAVPSKFPFNPGPQHDDDFTAPFTAMLRTVHVVRLHTPSRSFRPIRRRSQRKRGEYRRCSWSSPSSYKNARGNARLPDHHVIVKIREGHSLRRSAMRTHDDGWEKQAAGRNRRAH